MRVFIAGIDGYLGWSLATHLADLGHQVSGCDLMLRRKWVAEVGSDSATPIVSLEERVRAARETLGADIDVRIGDLQDASFVNECLSTFRPEAIVHLGEMPSAPYSMIDLEHCIETHRNNVEGNLNILFAMKELVPDAHLVKLGTMGEYGTPQVPIPEGFFEVTYRGHEVTLPFPRQAGSWYHQTKVHDSHNVAFACRIWGLRSTDIMQGVVFGTRIEAMRDDDRLRTRFDFDECFGTAINRFCAQAIVGHPLTPYGAGHQKRGFLALKDSMQCLALAIENPPERGEYRVFNQFEAVYDVTELAELVAACASETGIDASIRNLVNPRTELEQHTYEADREKLLELGYQPTRDIKGEVTSMIADLSRFKDRIEAHRDSLVPSFRWDGTHKRVGFVDESDRDSTSAAG